MTLHQRAKMIVFTLLGGSTSATNFEAEVKEINNKWAVPIAIVYEQLREAKEEGRRS